MRRAAHLVPAQGPISVFIHHNTLHAFEHLPFERAVVEGGRRFGCEPFLSHERYREEMRRGRIRVEDVDAALAEELGAGALEERIGGLASRRELRLVLLQDPIVQETGAALSWALAETREALRNRSLWVAAGKAAHRAAPLPPEAEAPVRHRDFLLASTGFDTDALVHPVLIRLVSAFLDQGLAYWPMPGRESGFFDAVATLYGGRALTPGWMAAFARELGRLKRAGASALSSALESLEVLGVRENEWAPFVEATLLALRGFAGMMRQMETRPDLAPVEAPPASLVDFLAVRLLLERSALAHGACEELGFQGALAGLREELRRRIPEPTPPSPGERAYLLFQVARILGFPPEALERLSSENVDALLLEIEGFSPVDRRRLLHLAYERRHRVEVLDALKARAEEAADRDGAPIAQAIFCIDEREESIRRHLEEVEPRVSTFGAAGFFGVAMYYRGVEDAHARPLCPIGLKPEHEIEERAVEGPESRLLGKREARRFLGRLLHGARVGSRTFTRGTVLTAVLGIGNALPLTFRVLFPRLTARLRKNVEVLLEAQGTRLELDRDESRAPSQGTWSGFTVEEMASIVSRTLEDVGIASEHSHLAHSAPLVLVIGHGSSSLNNPHESAHDCGACGGGRGGPNARAFAQMANDSRVRMLLRERARPILESTWFVGGYHNTCDETLTLYDLDRVPPTHRGTLAILSRDLDRARAANAHERCRRFEILPRNLSVSAALAHVEARSEDLAQTRPEYGHATNAVCIVGRRLRTRGLYLDRRAFLVSYDPEGDEPNGRVLARVLGAALPVVAGINLEYYFSYVDPVGYGCGTKLPHNVTALLGVMDGHASDLRTGLPWQMVEIHEPVRLLVVVETEPAILESILRRDEHLGSLAENRWIQLATLSPTSSDIHLLGASGFAPYGPERRDVPRVSSSRDWYSGSLDHLPPARVVPGK